MSERVVIENLSGVAIFDSEEAPDFATDINIETMWPKGYSVATFKIRRGDIMADWAIHESYGVLIYDGATIIYQGRIETISRNMSGTDEYVTVQCAGWYVVLEERLIHKRWVDVKAISYLYWPDGLETDDIQPTFVNNRRDNILQVFMGTGDVSRIRGEAYRELYKAPSGYIRRILFNYVIRSNEGFSLLVFNIDNPTGNILGSHSDGHEWHIVSTKLIQSGAVTVTFQLGNTTSFEFRWLVNNSDLYDQNDYAHVSNLRVEVTYESGHRTATPTYSQGQLVEDIILLVNQVGAQLSTDFAQLGDPGLILNPFAMDEPDYAGPTIEKIASYGDTSLRTWGLCVWDRSDTADGLPRVMFEAMDATDYDYEVDKNSPELAGLNYEKVSSQLYNNVIVKYTDERKAERYRTSADNSALADNASIAAEYRRDKYLKIGDGDATRADYVGQRYIQYHKSRLTRGTITVRGHIRQKDGGYIPVNRVRAGQRIKLADTGEIFFIRHTAYESESQTIRISPDLPEDNIATLFLQRERGLGRLA